MKIGYERTKMKQDMVFTMVLPPVLIKELAVLEHAIENILWECQMRMCVAVFQKLMVSFATRAMNFPYCSGTMDESNLKLATRRW